MPDSIPCELVLDAHAPLAESPLWDAHTGTLLWADIDRGEIHRFDPADRSDRVWNVDLGVTAIALREQGGLLATTPHGFAFVELQEHAALIEVIPTPELTPEGVRMNDAKVGPAGRLWAGSTGDSTDPVAALFCLDGELQVREVLEGVTESNGLGWSPAETSMYHVDSNAGKVNVSTTTRRPARSQTRARWSRPISTARCPTALRSTPTVASGSRSGTAAR